MRLPVHVSETPNDACCHTCAIEDADGEHVADFVEIEFARRVVELLNATEGTR